MGGPTITSHPFPKKRFQAAVVSAIDQHAGAIQHIGEVQQAQGGVLADLALDRDALKMAVSQLQDAGTIWARLRWLFTGQ